MPLRLPARPVLYRRTLILLVHIALIPLAYLAAFGLRFDFQIPPQEFAHFQTTVWYLLGIRLIVFWAGGLYRGYWKHVGLRDLVDLGLAVTISAAAFVAALSLDRKSTRLNSSHSQISYAVFCLKKKNNKVNSASEL